MASPLRIHEVEGIKQRSANVVQINIVIIAKRIFHFFSVAAMKLKFNGAN